MVYEKDIIGKFVTLRSITSEDAEFSYNLRRDPRYVTIMGQPAESVEAQRQYIEWQREQPGDYYFVVYNKNNERIGLIGVYNIENETCETGRELNIGAPYETMEAELLLFDFCKTELGLKRQVGIIYKNNTKQFGMIRRRDCYRISETKHNNIPSYYLETTFDELEKPMNKIRNLLSKVSANGEDI